MPEVQEGFAVFGAPSQDDRFVDGADNCALLVCTLRSIKVEITCILIVVTLRNALLPLRPASLAQP